MRTLLLDTSTERGVIGLADGETLLHQQVLPADRRHARDLIPAVKSACEAVGWKLRSVELLAVGAGPGSYTGLRVGIAAVKALTLTNSAKIIALDSLEVVACRAGTAPRICAVADAQQQRIYTAWFRSDESGMTKRTSPTALQSTEEWLASLQPGDVVTGPAVGRWVERISPTCRIVNENERLPNAESLLALCRRELAAGRFADLHELEPIYLRPSAAEERRPA
jgi:tRNA threonylcarbamoyladenosine biosynthesis protein TsaB